MKIPDLFLPEASLPSSAFVTLLYEAFPPNTHSPQLVPCPPSTSLIVSVLNGRPGLLVPFLSSGIFSTAPTTAGKST